MWEFYNMCSVDCHTFILQLPIETQNSVAPEIQDFVSSLENCQNFSKTSTPQGLPKFSLVFSLTCTEQNLYCWRNKLSVWGTILLKGMAQSRESEWVVGHLVCKQRAKNQNGALMTGYQLERFLMGYYELVTGYGGNRIVYINGTALIYVYGAEKLPSVCSFHQN